MNYRFFYIRNVSADSIKNLMLAENIEVGYRVDLLLGLRADTKYFMSYIHHQTHVLAG